MHWRAWLCVTLVLTLITSFLIAAKLQGTFDAWGGVFSPIYALLFIYWAFTTGTCVRYRGACEGNARDGHALSESCGMISLDVVLLATLTVIAIMIPVTLDNHPTNWTVVGIFTILLLVLVVVYMIVYYNHAVCCTCCASPGDDGLVVDSDGGLVAPADLGPWAIVLNSLILIALLTFTIWLIVALNDGLTRSAFLSIGWLLILALILLSVEAVLLLSVNNGHERVEAGTYAAAILLLVIFVFFIPGGNFSDHALALFTPIYLAHIAVLLVTAWAYWTHRPVRVTNSTYSSIDVDWGSGM